MNKRRKKDDSSSDDSSPDSRRTRRRTVGGHVGQSDDNSSDSHTAPHRTVRRHLVGWLDGTSSGSRTSPRRTVKLHVVVRQSYDTLSPVGCTTPCRTVERHLVRQSNDTSSNSQMTPRWTVGRHFVGQSDDMSPVGRTMFGLCVANKLVGRNVIKHFVNRSCCRRVGRHAIIELGNVPLKSQAACRGRPDYRRACLRTVGGCTTTAQLLKVDSGLKEIGESVEKLKKDSKNMLLRASFGEEELHRGRIKIRSAWY
ncbi:hypothetical protein KSP39_PZI021620 [Platanthera zijinensis]|uniref:Uncharacterized protein n=1 Tax=Platanthera zijinensis TaxID=2320716 RepID=A0AAP0FWC9_9ASPA